MISNLPQHEEFLRKKRKKKIIKYSVIVAIVVGLVGLASYVSHRASIRISKIELSGGVLVKEEDVVMKTLEYLRGSHLGLFPKDNSFWYPRESLKKNLKDNFKRIDTVELNLKTLRILYVKITERKSVAMWCDVLQSGGILMEDGSGPAEQCYFMDQNSTIFAPAPIFSGDAYFKFYGLVASSSPIGAEYIASTTIFGELAQFVESVKNLSLRPQYVVAKDNGEFSMIISGGSEIYFDIKRPLTQVFDNLETLLSNPPLSKGVSNVEYIDLRYGNKLFYKMKE